MTDTSERSRRAVLTATAAAGATALAPTASAQARIDSYGMVPEPRAFSTDDYAGFFLHVGEATEGSADADRAATCTGQWSPEELAAYDATLIDRLAEDHREASTTLYAGTEAPVEPGSLFVVNAQHDCDGDYVGFELEGIGARVRDSGAADQSGAGFGVLAGMAGASLLGLGGLVRRHGG